MTIEDFLCKKIGFISLGCDKNRVDLEKMIFKIKSAGLNIVNDPSEANIIIVNTCSFLESSRLESIENIIDMSRYKGNNLEKLVVTGCLNELNYPDLESSLPEVNAFVRLKDNQNIVQILASLYGVDYTKVLPTDGRVLTTFNHFAYLKIADGCNNFCSYCLIPYIRGRNKSTPMDELLSEARTLATNGTKELILVAQDVTKYGIDLYGKKMLVDLIRQLSEIDGIQWIRLLYCYPEEIDDNLIHEIKNNPKVVKYLDIPLQHVSDNVLKMMNRRSTNSSIRSLFDKLRSEIPNIVLRSTFILGFPGETDDDFRDILDFLTTYKMQNVGFFKYSREEGTRAYNLPNQIDEKVKNDRLDQAYSLQYKIQDTYNNDLISKVFDVIIDYREGNYSVGRYYGQAPTIDGIIKIPDDLNVGDFYKIKIKSKSGYDLEGERV